MTIGELAATFEVSSRTILRDIEALGHAGVPVVTIRGPAGGVELVGDFRTELTGLTRDEAAALDLCGLPELAALLGRGDSARAARAKIRDALAPTTRPAADGLATWFHLDPRAWGQGASEPGHDEGARARLVRSVERGIRLRVELAENESRLGVRRTMEVDPIGLVHKAGELYVLVDPATSSDSEVAVALEERALALQVSALAGWRPTGDRSSRPRDLDVASLWQAIVAANRVVGREH
jgi:predicted DNA-binding transcriptional regulator YafY